MFYDAVSLAVLLGLAFIAGLVAMLPWVLGEPVAVFWFGWGGCVGVIRRRGVGGWKSDGICLE